MLRWLYKPKSEGKPEMTTANLTEIAQTLVNRFGAQDPIARMAISQARHAGAMVDFDLAMPMVDSWGHVYRDAAGMVTSHTEVGA